MEIVTHCIKFPGKVLDVSVLLDKKKFRSFENKDGANRVFCQLQDDRLGTLEVRKGKNLCIVPLLQCICTAAYSLYKNTKQELGLQ